MKKILILCVQLFLSLCIVGNIENSFATKIQLKISDVIAPFFSAKKTIKHYSNIPFEQLDSYTSGSYIDHKQMQASIKRFEVYAELLTQNGYNAITLDDINHLTTFKKTNIYSNTAIRKRNQEYQKYYKKIIAIAKEKNLHVYLNTDMQFYTSTLEKKIGKITSKNTKLPEINRLAFEEIFEVFPEISGIVLRIGEGGNAYNSGEYKSKIIYTKPREINHLLRSLLPLFEKHNKTLIFRTWTIGIGEVGDLIISTDTYDQVFKGITSKNIIVSIKHTPGDFFWFEDENPTLGHGNLPQIAEIQIRREYEGGGDFPNYIGDFYHKLYLSLQNKKNVIGIMNWNQTGGWGWGHNIIFNFGFNFWNEVNFFAVGNILKKGKPDLKSVLSQYDFSYEENQALFDILKNSRNILKKGWYIDEFRSQKLKLGGVYIPPLSYIWWDRMTSSPIILSFIYFSLLDPELSIKEAQKSMEKTQNDLQQWKKIARATPQNKSITHSLENRVRIFEILTLFREAFIHYFQTGEKIHQISINQKIQAYQNFGSKKKIFSFHFDEINAFYSGNNSNTVTLILYTFSCIIYFTYLIMYRLIKSWHRKSTTKKYSILLLLCVNITLLIVLPFFFLSDYNFYWILFRMSGVFLLFISLYTIIIGIFIRYLFHIHIKLKRSLGSILYFLAPVILSGQLIIILSYFFGEAIFWKYLTLPILQEKSMWIFMFLGSFYYGLFIYYGFRFSNIYKFLKNTRFSRSIFMCIFFFFPIFVWSMFQFQITTHLVNFVIGDILPVYFQSAGSGIGHFF